MDIYFIFRAGVSALPKDFVLKHLRRGSVQLESGHIVEKAYEFITRPSGQAQTGWCCRPIGLDYTNFLLIGF